MTQADLAHERSLLYADTHGCWQDCGLKRQVIALGDAAEQNQDAAQMAAHAADAANFLKALGHDGRLMILCHLTSGPKSVSELENLLSSRQAVVSQQLARLRFEGMVSARREGQAIFYSILDPKVREMLILLDKLFCQAGEDRS